jgi:predicted metal-dependent hydrolase
MMDILVLAGATAALAAAVVGIIMYRRRPRKLKIDLFQEKWRVMQKQLTDKQQWPQALIDADKLLDDALKRRRFPGKSMGERLTKAQRVLTDNEGVWYGHKLRQKLEAEPDTKLKEKEIKQALIGIRQALKDLGALPDGK